MKLVNLYNLQTNGISLISYAVWDYFQARMKFTFSHLLFQTCVTIMAETMRNPQ